MRPTPPPRLYKYQPFSARTLTSLKSRELWFGAPSGLNDPFDCAVPYRLGAVTLDDCERYLAHKPELAEQVRGAVGYLDAAGRPTQALRQAIENGARKAFEEQVSRSASRGVACFSEIADSTLLWSHYGGGHRGICLEFDTSSHPFRENLTNLPLRQRDGWVEVSQKPGLGIEVNPQTVKQFSS